MKITLKKAIDYMLGKDNTINLKLSLDDKDFSQFAEKIQLDTEYELNISLRRKTTETPTLEDLADQLYTKLLSLKSTGYSTPWRPELSTVEFSSTYVEDITFDSSDNTVSISLTKDRAELLFKDGKLVDFYRYDNSSSEGCPWKSWPYEVDDEVVRRVILNILEEC